MHGHFKTFSSSANSRFKSKLQKASISKKFSILKDLLWCCAVAPAFEKEREDDSTENDITAACMYYFEHTLNRYDYHGFLKYIINALDLQILKMATGYFSQS